MDRLASDMVMLDVQYLLRFVFFAPTAALGVPLVFEVWMETPQPSPPPDGYIAETTA